MEQITIDLIPNGKMPMLHASQYDDGRQVRINLTENRQAYTLTGNEVLSLAVRKADNTLVTMDIANTYGGKSYVEFATTEQMCACAGMGYGELRIKEADKDIGTLNFTMWTEQSPEEGGVRSDSEINNLARQVNELVDDEMDNYYDKTEADEKFATSDDVDNALANKIDKSNPTGTGSIAVGQNVVASGGMSQAFGASSTASGAVSHAEGISTTASGMFSHAEGEGSTASGAISHAEGNYTVANHQSQHVFGEYNIPDDSEKESDRRGNYVEIVGNGARSSERSNARTLDWSGNETLAGDLTYNGNKSITSEVQRLDDKIDNLPSPMIFKGTLGVGGTIQTLPAASTSNEGWTYKVITDGTYAGQTAKVGDVFTSNGSAWVLIPSGDDDNDTWRAIKVNGVEKLGNGISSGSLDVVDTDNIEAEFDNDGNKLKIKTKNIYTETEVNNLVAEAIYDVLPSEVASGSIANFETDLTMPLKSAKFDVNAVQESGTPTPSSPKAISGVSAVNVYQRGKNLFDISTADKKWVNSSNQIINGIDNTKSNIIPCNVGATITISSQNALGSNNFLLIATLDENGNVTSRTVKTSGSPASLTKTASSGDKAFLVSFYDYTLTGGGMVEVGSSATSYEAYNPLSNTILINLGGTYYGGKLTQDKNGKRQFKVTHDISKFDELNWSRSNNSGIWQAYLFYVQIPEKVNGGSLACTNYHYDIHALTTMPDKEITRTASSKYIYVRDDDYTDIPTFKTANANTVVLYELAEPFYIDLPDGEPLNALIGTNNLFADSGDMECSFKCGVAMYVDNHSGGGNRGLAKSGGEESKEEVKEEPKEEKIDEPITRQER